MDLPSGEYDAEYPLGISSLTGKPPLTGTRKNCVNLFENTARCEANKTFAPSGVKPLTRSSPGCHVNLVGTPPSTGIIKTSVFPSYCALNEISFPSGEKQGFDSTPSSIVSLTGCDPSRLATHRSSA